MIVELAVVKLLGEFVWHKHDDTDDFFLVLSGCLTIQLRDRDVVLAPGEIYVVPRGAEHCPKADEEVHVLLIEPECALSNHPSQPCASAIGTNAAGCEDG